MYQPSIPQQYQQQKKRQPFQFNARRSFPFCQQLPPTLNGFEPHGETGRSMQQQNESQQRSFLEQQHRMLEQQQIQSISLASPSSTPSSQFRHELTMPDAYFPPLTSSVLHAQDISQMQHRYQQHQQDCNIKPSTAEKSVAPSISDPNVDIEAKDDSMSLPEPATKFEMSRSRKVAISGTLVVNDAKQCPTNKAHKRKFGTIASKDADTHVNDEQCSDVGAPKSARVQLTRSFESSEAKDTSPEPFRDMPKGAPGSVSKLPTVSAQASAGHICKAATPKSILLTSTAQSSNGLGSSAIDREHDQMSLDDFQLPEAADNSDAHRAYDIQIEPVSSMEHTLRSTASWKTPRLSSYNTRSSVRPTSTCASSAFTFSPTTISTPATLPKDQWLDGGAQVKSKEDDGVSATASTLASPAPRRNLEGSRPLPPQPQGLCNSQANHQQPTIPPPTGSLR
jgi:hypothetical protein